MPEAGNWFGALSGCRATYAANWERLAAIKKKYDPTNFFSVNQSIARAA